MALLSEYYTKNKEAKFNDYVVPMINVMEQVKNVMEQVKKEFLIPLPQKFMPALAVRAAAFPQPAAQATPTARLKVRHQVC